ncbi:MAG TPA: cyclase family protein [Chlamydiales bacterium]|nr:cyclase family protein [Chlamydiales bacterium]
MNHSSHYPRGSGFQGKIVGRGVLLDYAAYAESKGIQYIPCEQHLITAEDLDACAKAQKVEFRQGDILFVRMGYVNWYNKADVTQRVKASNVPTHAVGVRQTEAELEWLWSVYILKILICFTQVSPRNHHFAAVVCDAPAFEARPCIQEWNLHDYLLALWGVSSVSCFFFATAR